MNEEHDHFGPDCPECRAQAETCRIIGGFAEAMERMSADGAFERLGAAISAMREKALLDALTRK